MDNILEKEARVFCRYLIREEPSVQVIELYTKAIGVIPAASSEKEKKIVSFAVNNSLSLPLLDAASAIVKPESELRRRLYILFAILEATPQYNQKFLTKDRNVFYLFKLLFTGTRAVLRAALGLILYKIV